MTPPAKSGRSSARAASSNGNGSVEVEVDEKVATRDDVEAAVDEARKGRQGRKPKAKHAEFRGLELKLPDDLPPALMFDAVEMEANPTNGMSALRAIRSIVGPEQFIAIRNKLTAGDQLDDLTSLISDVMGQYGFSVGKSSASEGS